VLRDRQPEARERAPLVVEHLPHRSGDVGGGPRLPPVLARRLAHLRGADQRLLVHHDLASTARIGHTQPTCCRNQRA
jgi:hypothetical protein